ncbi:hypothetical protein, partial [Staphylococcus pseudintermedius]|uniref:hypothetical protein n=1 Tax=Staphylococcus pseudintermedius TaxID=283734 RepID=UPI0036F29791
RIELEGQPLGKGSHDGNQKPKIVGRTSLTKYCINRIKSFYVPPPLYFAYQSYLTKRLIAKKREYTKKASKQ